MRTVSEREKRLTRLGYRALALASKHRHLGDAWVAYMAGKSGRLFEAAIAEWRLNNERETSRLFVAGRVARPGEVRA